MAELKALGQTVNDVLDIRLMLRRMNFLDTKPSVIWCDSQAAIAIVYRAELNATRSYPRNAAVRIMHVREAVNNGEITIRYVHGLGVVGLAVDGLGVVGLAVDGLGVVGLAVDGLGVVGLAVDGLGVVGLAVVGLARRLYRLVHQVRSHHSQRQQTRIPFERPFLLRCGLNAHVGAHYRNPAAVHAYLRHLYHDTPLRPPATHSTSDHTPYDIQYLRLLASGCHRPPTIHYHVPI
jgi:hypothetical protein